MSSRLGSAAKAIEHTTVFPGGAAGKTTLPDRAVPLQFGRSNSQMFLLSAVRPQPTLSYLA
jgi:hypothetical protein